MQNLIHQFDIYIYFQSRILVLLGSTSNDTSDIMGHIIIKSIFSTNVYKSQDVLTKFYSRGGMYGNKQGQIQRGSQEVPAPYIFCRARALDFAWVPLANRMYQIMRIDFDNYIFFPLLRGTSPVPTGAKDLSVSNWGAPLLKLLDPPLAIRLEMNSFPPPKILFCKSLT